MPAPTDAAPGAPRSRADLFWSFSWLALQGFGGVLAVVQRELVERKRWLTREQFVEDWAVAQIMPGPNVVNLSMMIGDRHFGLSGALVALAGMLALPSVVGLVGLRRDIILLFVGDSFTPSVFALGVMSLNVLVVGLSNLFGIQVLVPQGTATPTLTAALLGVVVALALNLLLMPKFAERGAAVSIVLAEICVTAYLTASCRSLLKTILAEWTKLVPYAAGSALIALYLLLLPGAGHGSPTRVAAAVLGSAMIYTVALALARDEFAMSLLSRIALSRFRPSSRRRR